MNPTAKMDYHDAPAPMRVPYEEAFSVERIIQAWGGGKAGKLGTGIGLVMWSWN